MMDFEDFGGSALSTKPLSKAEKAAAVLLAMGKGVAGKLLKYFTQAELQNIIACAQSLRAIPRTNSSNSSTSLRTCSPRARASWTMPQRSRAFSKRA